MMCCINITPAIASHDNFDEMWPMTTDSCLESCRLQAVEQLVSMTFDFYVTMVGGIKPGECRQSVGV